MEDMALEELIYILTAIGIGGSISATIGSYIYLDRREASKLRKEIAGMSTSEKIEHLIKYASKNPLNPHISRRVARKEFNDQDFETFLKTMYIDLASLEEWRKICKSQNWFARQFLRGEY
jgi:hypothetical protein